MPDSPMDLNVTVGSGWAREMGQTLARAVGVGFLTVLQVGHATQISCNCAIPLFLSPCVGIITLPCLLRRYLENIHLLRHSFFTAMGEIGKKTHKERNMLGHLHL